jgi:UDP-N-acetyl-D-glucosamine/UDP-N-acetyl-D-galactosamine dehydrogenase
VRIAQECIRRLLRHGRADASVTVLGLTFKENVPDIRNSKVPDIIRELQSFGIEVQVHDPLAHADEVIDEYSINLSDLTSLRPADAVILAVAHKDYVDGGWSAITRCLKDGEGVVLDVKSTLDRASMPPGVDLWRL